jgi:hypothetical protein
LGRRRWGRPRGSPRAWFGGSEGALEGPAGQLGDARRWPPWRREIPARPGRSWATRGGGGFHGVPGRCRVAGRRQNEGEGAVHRAAPMVPAAGHEAVGGGGPACRGRSSGSLLTRHACLLATAGPTATRLGVGAGLGRNAHCSRRRGLLGALGARGASGNAGHGRLGGPARARARSDAARRGAVRLEMCWCANV